MSADPYPPGFANWPQDRRNAFFAKEARDYRERNPNGGAARDGFDSARAGPDGQPANWAAVLTCASSIKSEPVSWLWRDWLARGKLHIIAGQPGTGKTTIAMKMAATVSAGSRWPDGSAAKQGNVIVWSGEDDHADTLIPRLDSSGADLKHVLFAGEMSCGKERRAFDPAKDIPALQAAIKAAGGASLIIIDPIVSAIAADSHKNSETRRALQPVVDMAAELNAVIVGITHFTKGSEGRSPIDRVTGSVAFGALARVVMVAAREQDGDDGKPGQRVLMRAKSNIGPDDGGFKYDLQLVPMREYPDIIVSVVSWGASVSGTARDILAAAEATDGNGDATVRREAEDFLLDFLMDGPKPAKECKAAAAEAALSLITVKRAKSRLRIASVKDGMTGGWVWSLPEGDHHKPKGLIPGRLSPFGNYDPLRGESGAVSDGSSGTASDGWEGEI